MIFLTYNDNFSGIYKSQVIDVCSFLQRELKTKVKLVAFVSLRNYGKQKNLIKSNYANAVILPMFPKARFWRMNGLLLLLVCLFSGNKKIWARGPFACNLAINMKKMGLAKKVIFDARGAYLAELTEYNVVQSDSVKKDIARVEERALLKSDAQLAVSNKLVEWWLEQYNFTPKLCAAIPCTISSHFNSPLPVEKEIDHLRANLGFAKNDLVLVYSGTSAGWQSFTLIDDYLYDLFSKNKNIKLIFLSDETPKESKLFASFTDRIIRKWVKPHEVRDLLLAGDYGLLVREESVTNKVASPVKFAEYLSCGLQIIISDNIGDFSDFVKQNTCGYLYRHQNSLEPATYAQKMQNHKLALKHFTKECNEVVRGYEKLLSA